MNRERGAARFRWAALAVFALSTAINYLDRATLATLAPAVKAEFHLSNAGYGWIVNTFAVTYTISAPFAGLLVDRVGLDRGAMLAVGVWSCAGIATGLTRGVGGLCVCRAALGMAEAAGIPAAGKAIHQFLKPAERALGNAANQAAVSLGLVLAPPIATWIAVRSGWRHGFIATGSLGLLWIPIWAAAGSRWRTPAPVPPAAAARAGLPGDRRLWIFVLANALAMIPYSLWVNFTTLYFVDAQHLTLVEAAWYAWIPPVLAAAGGLAGGWISLRWINGGLEPTAARRRACLAASVLALVTAAVPAAPNPGLAALGISASFFAVAAFSVNLYSLPLDAFGGARAAFAVSWLTASAGASGFLSPVFGWLIDRRGYAPVTAIAALAPIAASAVLYAAGDTP